MQKAERACRCSCLTATWRKQHAYLTGFQKSTLSAEQSHAAAASATFNYAASDAAALLHCDAWQQHLHGRCAMAGHCCAARLHASQRACAHTGLADNLHSAQWCMHQHQDPQEHVMMRPMVHACNEDRDVSQLPRTVFALRMEVLSKKCGGPVRT